MYMLFYYIYDCMYITRDYSERGAHRPETEVPRFPRGREPKHPKYVYIYIYIYIHIYMYIYIYI